MIPGRSDQLVIHIHELYHGTTLNDIDPVDKNLAFNQSGISLILPAKLKSSLTNSNNRKLIGAENDNDIDFAQMLSSIKLNDADVKRAPRATMLKRARKDRSTEKVYQKERRATYTFPKQHTYMQKRWTKKAMLVGIVSRYQRGRKIRFGTSYNKPALAAALLRDDGVDVPVTWTDPVRK
jgi:hypothetical protein